MKMKKNNLAEKQGNVEHGFPKADLVEDKASSLKLRTARTRYAVLIATLMGALLGGSCDGCNCSATWKGNEVAGCSCVDTGDKTAKPTKHEEKLDY